MKYQLHRLRIIVVRFFETYLPFMIVPFYIIIGILLLITNNVDLNPKLMFLEDSANWFIEDFYKRISEKESIIITVSAVFIGIYFTIFSLLGNIRDDSTVNILSEHHFKKLLNYIFYAFISSFSYLLLSLITNPAETNLVGKLIFLALLTYMFYSAFRFGVIMFYSYRLDFKNYKQKLVQQKLEDQKLKNAIYKIDKYIDELNNERQLEKNKELKERQ